MIVRGETSVGNRPAREERAAHDDRMRRAAQSWRSRWQHPAACPPRRPRRARSRTNHDSFAAAKRAIDEFDHVHIHIIYVAGRQAPVLSLSLRSLYIIYKYIIH